MVKYCATNRKNFTDESRRCRLKNLNAQYIPVTNLIMILIGHSMSEIIATESILSSLFNNTAFSMDGEKSITVSILPFIEGVLSFDTQYLGIAPSVLAHGIDIPYQFAHDLFKQPKAPMDTKAGSDGGCGPA